MAPRALVVDLHPLWWGKALSSTDDVANALAVFVDALTAYVGLQVISPGGKPELIALGAGVDKVTTLFSSSGAEPDPVSHAGRIFRQRLTTALRSPIQPGLVGERPKESQLPAALVQALCFINSALSQGGRLDSAESKVRGQILVVKVSDDATANYMSLMNAYFTAQKLKIPVDSLLLGPSSVLAEQAADITDGLMIHAKSLLDVPFYLQSCFVVPPEDRRLVNVPRVEDVDYRPACFCHQKLIDSGFVCSVCLSVFCAFKPICPTCQTVFKFNFRALSKLKKK